MTDIQNICDHARGDWFNNVLAAKPPFAFCPDCGLALPAPTVVEVPMGEIPPTPEPNI